LDLVQLIGNQKIVITTITITITITITTTLAEEALAEEVASKA